jgi:hypothetical protein
MGTSPVNFALGNIHHGVNFKSQKESMSEENGDVMGNLLIMFRT